MKKIDYKRKEKYTLLFYFFCNIPFLFDLYDDKGFQYNTF